MVSESTKKRLRSAVGRTAKAAKKAARKGAELSKKELERSRKDAEEAEEISKRPDTDAECERLCRKVLENQREIERRLGELEGRPGRAGGGFEAASGLGLEAGAPSADGDFDWTGWL